tara:strand:- start:12435 stop:13706 length:1272 start_codon:yes stop_codon:yes gene_type:complete
MPNFHGSYVAMWCAIPAFIIIVLWLALEQQILNALLLAHFGSSIADLDSVQIELLINDVKNIASGSSFGRGKSSDILLNAADHYESLQLTFRASVLAAGLSFSIASFLWAWKRISPTLKARNYVEFAVKVFLFICSTIAIITTVGIVLSVLFESIRFFGQISFWDFLFGSHWSPQTAIRDDQVGSSGSFGAIPLFTGTLTITIVAMLVALPIGLFSAIYMAEFASPRFRKTVKPILEILAGIPTVVYGFFAVLTIAPAIRGFGTELGLTVASESALAAGIVMGIMIIPFVSSLSDDAIVAVPKSLREGSLALGSTHSETIKKVVIPAALPGIVAACLLAISRAIGETMIVVMAAGLAANLTANPLNSVTTVTVQIVTLLVGDQEFDSAKTLAAFALGLVLFVSTLGLNIVALYVSRRYREQYD